MCMDSHGGILLLLDRFSKDFWCGSSRAKSGLDAGKKSSSCFCIYIYPLIYVSIGPWDLQFRERQALLRWQCCSYSDGIDAGKSTVDYSGVLFVAFLIGFWNRKIDRMNFWLMSFYVDFYRICAALFLTRSFAKADRGISGSSAL